MDFERLQQKLASNAQRIRLLVEGVEPEQARWKPDVEEWSILEVVNHLYDEEREDFRVRLDITLHKPNQRWPPIDPGGWVEARGYNGRDLGGSLNKFLEERESSLAWLARLQTPDWDVTYEAPWGPIKAGDIFVAWVAHDQLHMRQLVELHRAILLRLAGPYDVRYAGQW